MKTKRYTHQELVERARTWLFKSHGVVVTEISGAAGEEPDAIGFKGGWSTLVECKASRADFLLDRKKYWRQPHRSATALGDFRYYCVPKDMVGSEEVPEKWGLLETRGKGLVIKKKAAPLSDKVSHRGEVAILSSVIRRVGVTRPPLRCVSIRCFLHTSKNKPSLTAIRPASRA